MKQVKRTYTDFNEFVKNEPELVESLIQMINENSEEEVTELVTYNWRTTKYEPMTEMSDIINLIREWGDYEKEIDSLYITKTYYTDTYDGKFTLEAIGTSYLKDQSICDEQMEDEITVIDNIALEIQAEQEKAIKAKKKKTEHANKWVEFIKEEHKKYSKYEDAYEEILIDLMRNYEFPKKIK